MENLISPISSKNFQLPWYLRFCFLFGVGANHLSPYIWFCPIGTHRIFQIVAVIVKFGRKMFRPYIYNSVMATYL